MFEHDIEFAQLIATLREGREALAGALELLEGEGSGMTTIHRLLEAARDLADLAQTFVLQMRDNGADEAALRNANDLAAFFWATEDRIEMVLGLDQA